MEEFNCNGFQYTVDDIKTDFTKNGKSFLTFLLRIFYFPMIKVLLIMPRVFLSCMWLTMFLENLSVERGQSIK